MQKMRVITVITILILSFVIGALFSQQSSGPIQKKTSINEEVRLPTPIPLAPFHLTAHDLKPFDNDRLKNKWTFVFFGYTHCPDVCPTTLVEFARVVRKLEGETKFSKDTQVVFVSVDAWRDTPESLAEYVSFYNKSFLGATGTIKELAVLVRQLGAKFALGTTPAGEPAVNHSSFVHLIDPQARYYARFKIPHNAKDIYNQYLDIRKRYQ